MLCYAWDYRRGLKLPPESPLTDLQPEDTLLMLRRIAWHMQGSDTGLRANAIPQHELTAVIDEYFSVDWRFDPPKARRAGAEMVNLLQERNWLLTTRGPALLGFVHRTFLEYLCALELNERFREQSIGITELCDDHVINHVGDDSWREVTRLLCGQLPVKAAEHLIVAVLDACEQAGLADEALRFGLQLIGEVEPRQLPALEAVCERLTDLLYAFLRDVPLTGSDLVPRPALEPAGHRRNYLACQWSDTARLSGGARRALELPVYHFRGNPSPLGHCRPHRRVSVGHGAAPSKLRPAWQRNPALSHQVSRIATIFCS